MSARCPACSAPMVGTKPIVTPSRWSRLLQTDIAAIDRIVLTRKTRRAGEHDRTAGNRSGCRAEAPGGVRPTDPSIREAVPLRCDEAPGGASPGRLRPGVQGRNVAGGAGDEE